MDLEGNIAKFTDVELQAMGHLYPPEVEIDRIDTEALMGSVADREVDHLHERQERDRLDRVRQARWLKPPDSSDGDGVHVGETTEAAFRLADDKAIVRGLVDQIHAHRMNVTLDGPTEGIPND